MRAMKWLRRIGEFLMPDCEACKRGIKHVPADCGRVHPAVRLAMSQAEREIREIRERERLPEDIANRVVEKLKEAGIA